MGFCLSSRAANRLYERCLSFTGRVEVRGDVQRGARRSRGQLERSAKERHSYIKGAFLLQSAAALLLTGFMCEVCPKH